MLQREFENNQSLGRNGPIRPHHLVRWWPLVLTTILITTGAALWAHKHDVASYTASTAVVVVPLSQWDETFLGTELARDSGDATRTAMTVAAELNSDRSVELTAHHLGGSWTPEAVRAAVSVAAPGETNIIEIVAKGPDPETAGSLSAAFAAATMADRWQTISTQLDAMIDKLKNGSLAVVGDQQGANPTAAEQTGRLQTLTLVRSSGADPTLRVLSTSAPVRSPQMSWSMTLGLAALGGLFLGVLAAWGLEFLWPRNARRDRAAKLSGPAAHASNGSSHADTRAR